MDILFLLKPDFADAQRDGTKKYYCPDCALIEGVLSYYPHLRAQLDIRYIDYPRPRKEIVELVGEAHQGCPNLLLDPAHHTAAAAASFYKAGHHLHSDNNTVILDYLSEVYGVPVAHF